ncbi:rhomboid family intramembrane serine protease [Rhodococcus sp. (in: high G+C Gram-positive bacteria)]|uniref:rhomboid family intramembrane serine protease n=1 Tax=Rhodococcus sp. TaxID=1831 RepID=UPI00388E0BD1
MSASGDDPRLWAFYAAVVALTALAAMPDPRSSRAAARSWWWPPPMAAVVLWGVVAVASVTRLIVPSLVELFRREPVRTRDGGQWWRVLTAGLVEDGGVVVTAANLALLAVVAVAAVRIWGWYRAAALFVVGQILWGLFTTFVSPSVGAGTSGATLALAASIAGLWPVVGARRRLLLASSATFLLGVVLVAFDDAHGVAVLIGMLLGAVLGTVLPPRRPAVFNSGSLGGVTS